MTDYMPDEDHLDEALLDAARRLGQCPVTVGTDTVRPRRCAYVAGHLGEHAPSQFQGNREGTMEHELPRGTESVGTRIQAEEPQFVTAEEARERIRRTSGATEERDLLDAFGPDRDPFMARGERPELFERHTPHHESGAKALSDCTCAGCPSTILAGTRCQVVIDGEGKHTYHLGCHASMLWHRAHGLPFPPARGTRDGKALEQAATQEAPMEHEDHRP